MSLRRRTFSELVSDGLAYLANNTSITYFGDGSIARGLVEAMALEVTRHQDFVSVHYDSRFLTRAGGVFLDLFGEMLGVPRIQETRAAIEVEDQFLRFYVSSGTLGTRLPDPSNPDRGLIPATTVISNEAGTVEFSVSKDIVFPKSARSVYVSAVARQPGKDMNVGINQLTKHNLGVADVKVTNDATVSTGTDIEPDDEYRYRLSKAMTSRFGGNETSIQTVAQTARGVAQADVLEFARGAGTFDVLLVPVGNRLSKASKDETARLLDQVTAFGVSARVTEPDYIPFAVCLQLQFQDGVDKGVQAALRDSVRQAVLAYFASLPMGGELVISRVTAAALSVSNSIKDARITCLAIDGKSRTFRNFRLRKNELFVPDTQAVEAVEVL